MNIFFVLFNFSFAPNKCFNIKPIFHKGVHNLLPSIRLYDNAHFETFHLNLTPIAW
jgi:hypothetical protein